MSDINYKVNTASLGSNICVLDIYLNAATLLFIGKNKYFCSRYNKFFMEKAGNDNNCFSDDNAGKERYDAGNAVSWHAVKLFAVRQKDVADYFADCGLESFIPMCRRDYVDADGKRRHDIRPVVTNLIFVQAVFGVRRMLSIYAGYPKRLFVMRKSKDNPELYNIPDKQMREFILMCNPEIEMKKFLSESEAKLKKGQRVVVDFGPLKGLSGRLVRQSHKYFLLKDVPGMAVMIKVSRWCCRPVEE